nr:hypothetical protein [uncultured Roseateles sp.]
MAYKPPLDEGVLHSTNFRSIRDWIERNKARIKAKPNKSVLYSGRDYDLEMKKGMTAADLVEFKGTPMYLRLEQTRKRMRDQNIPYDFEMLEDVLKSMRDYPKLLDKDHQEQHFSNAFDFFHSLSHSDRLSPLLPNRKKIQDDSWKRLSEIYAGNAVGDIKILDGAADDYGKLREDKVFIQKELAALLKNDKLSPAAKKLLEKKISEYGSYFDRRYTELIARLDEGKSRLSGKGR